MFLRIKIFVVLLASLLWATPDSLIVSSAGMQSATGIWWPDVKKKGDAPVVVWFHGGMTSGNCEKGYVAGGDFARLFPDAIVVSVSACRQNHWATEMAMSVVDVALDSVAARRKKSVQEVHLVGISDGALGAIMYSYLGKRNVHNRLLMSSYGASLGEAPAVARMARLQTGRWRFLQGGADRLYPSAQTVPWIESFCKNVKVDCDLRFESAGEHDWLYWREKHLDWIKEAIFPGTP